MSDIAASAREQASGIEQVTRAVAGMDALTQQNEGSASQSSAVAADLSGQARELADMVGAFQLERRGVAARARAGRVIERTT